MPEPLTLGIGSAALAYLAKDGVSKLLGPSCDYLGKELQQWVEKRQRNVARIIENACRKAGSSLEKPGGVSLRVLKEVFQEGSFLDDAIGVEYFGGLMACSRSETAEDDLYLSTVKLIGQLTSYQLRAHYVLCRTVYEILRRRADDKDASQEEYVYRPFYMPLEDFISSAQFPDKLKVDERVLRLCFKALEINDLVKFEFRPGETIVFDAIRGRGSIRFPSPGFVFSLTPESIDLFMHAHGLTSCEPTKFYEPALGERAFLPMNIKSACYLYDLQKVKS